MTTYLRCICAISISVASVPGWGDDPPRPVFVDHVPRQLQGWTVHVDTRLLHGEGSDVGQQALAVLDGKLLEIVLRLPEDRLEKLRTVPIWIDFRHELERMQYHPGEDWLRRHGYDPQMVKGVHIPQAQRLIEHVQNHAQPWAVMHELAHAYHDRFLGWDHAGIRQSYERFVAAGQYEVVLDIGGHRRRHYGLTNEREFFAEMTESFLGTNDFYPFVRGELRDELPDVYDLLERIWLAPQ